MLGKTAGGIYWMARFLERGENTARLIEAGFRMALTRSRDNSSEWKSVITTAGARRGFDAKYDEYNATNVVDYLLRDRDNHSSVLSVTEAARTNARMVRTALTTEVWEAVNENWMVTNALLKRPIKETELPEVLTTIRQQSALVRGAFQGTMLRNDIFDFVQIGKSLERADNTVRILDVKYFALLPSESSVGSALDKVQWETILRSVSAHRSFRWLNEHKMTATRVADFLILDSRFPRSLSFSVRHMAANLSYLEKDYGESHASQEMVQTLRQKLKKQSIESIMKNGLHQFVGDFIRANNALGSQIEQDYRFNG